MTLLLISFCPCWSARQSNSSIVTVQPFNQCFLTAGAGKRADRLNSFSLFKYNIGRLTFRCLGHTSVKGHTLRHIPDLSVCLDLCAALHTYHIELFLFCYIYSGDLGILVSRLVERGSDDIALSTPSGTETTSRLSIRIPLSVSGYSFAKRRYSSGSGNLMRSFAVPSFTVHSAISAFFRCFRTDFHSQTRPAFLLRKLLIHQHCSNHSRKSPHLRW